MRCVNCGVATQRLRRHFTSPLPVLLVNILARWLAIEVPQDANICHPCYELLNSQTASDIRLFGHIMICIACGRSVRNTQNHAVASNNSMLQDLPRSHPAFHQDMNYACHPCWMRHQRHSNEHRNREILLEPEQQPGLEPRPEPAPRLIPELDVHLPNYKRPANTTAFAFYTKPKVIVIP